ncbi:hypothetical protein RQP46_001640 [Phenoliferia psychrophenolica]
MSTPSEKVDALFQLLEEQGSGDYIGEHISQLEHCLQAAHSATLASAPRTTVLAALLHDVGQFLPGDETAQLLYHGQNVGRVGHERLGEDWWLTSASCEYLDGLSDASKASLVLQGGPFSATERAKFEEDPLFKEKVALRRWDDAAKVVDLDVPGLRAYRDVAVEILTRGC